MDMDFQKVAACIATARGLSFQTLGAQYGRIPRFRTQQQTFPAAAAHQKPTFARGNGCLVLQSNQTSHAPLHHHVIMMEASSTTDPCLTPCAAGSPDQTKRVTQEQHYHSTDQCHVVRHSLLSWLHVQFSACLAWAALGCCRAELAAHHRASTVSRAPPV